MPVKFPQYSRLPWLRLNKESYTLGTENTTRCPLCSFPLLLLEMLLGEDIKIEVDPPLIERDILEHREKVGPFGVDQRIRDQILNDDGVESVKVLGHFGHNDNYKIVS